MNFKEIERLLNENDETPIKDFSSIEFSPNDLDYLNDKLGTIKTVHYIKWNKNQTFRDDNIKSSIEEKLVDNLLSDKKNYLVVDLTKLTIDASYLEHLTRSIENKFTKIGAVVLSASDEHRFKENENYKRLIEIQETNYETYERYPNEYVHALLTYHCNNNGADKEINEKIKDLGWDNGERFEIPKTQIEEEEEENDEDNVDSEDVNDDSKPIKYFSILYKNKSKRQMVLVFRGMNLEAKDFFIKENKLQAAVYGSMNNEITIHSYYAYEKSIEVFKRSQEANYSLSFTGYSFGAWLAEQSAYFCCKEFPGKSVRAITFESPGSWEIIENMSETNLRNQMTIEENAVKYLDVRTFLFAPNFLNTCNRHIGRVFRVSESRKGETFFDQIVETRIISRIKSKKVRQKLKEWYKNLVKKQISKFYFYLNGLRALFTSDLHWLLDEFDPDTGRFREKPKEVLSWPKIEFSPNSGAFKKLDFSKLITEFAKKILPDKIAKLLGKPIDWILNLTIKKIAENYLSSVVLIVNIVSQLTSEQFNTDKFLEYLEFKSNGSRLESFMLQFKGNYHVKAFNEYRENLWLSDRFSVDSRIYEFYKSLDRYELRGPLIYLFNKLKKSFQLIESGADRRLVELVTSENSGISVERVREWYLRFERIYQICEDRSIQLYKEKIPLRLNIKTIQNDFGGLPLKKFLKSSQNLFERIKQLLTKNSFVYIYGQSGNGKTTLARQYGYSTQNDFLIQFIISSDLSTNIIELRNRFLDSSFDPDINEIDLMKLIKKRIDSLKVLFIFDNVNSMDEVGFIMESLNNQKFLITTKNYELFSREFGIEKNPFDSDECMAYLNQFHIDTRRKKDKDEWTNLVNKCIGINSSIKDFENGVAYFLSHILTCTFDDLFSFVKNESFQKCKIVQNENTKAFEILCKLAYLDGNFIDLNIIKTLTVDHQDLSISLAYLVNNGFLTVKSRGYQTMDLEMHERIQSQVRGYLKHVRLQDELIEDLLVKFISMLKVDKNELQKERETVEKLNKHVFSISKEWGENESVYFSILISGLARINEKVFVNYNDALNLLLIKKDKLEKSTNSELAALTNTLFDIGKLYRLVGKYDISLEFFENSLRLKRKSTGNENNKMIGMLKGEIGHTYFLSKNYPKAHENLNESIRMFEENTTDYAMVLQLISQVYLGEKNLKSAERNMFEAYEILNKKLPPNSTTISLCLHDIGMLYREKKEHEKSVKYLKKSLNVMQNLGLNHHPEISKTLIALGEISINLDRFEYALNCFLESLDIVNKIVPLNEKKLAEINHRIGSVLIDMGRYKEAENWLNESLRINSPSRTLSESGLACTFHELGRLSLYLSDYTKSLEYLHQALEIYEIIKTNDKLSIGATKNLIGQVFIEQGKYNEAIEYLNAELNESKSNLRRAGLSQQIGKALLKQGCYKEARKHFFKSFDLFREVFPLNNSIFGSLMILMGQIKIEAGEYNTALELFNKILSIYEKVLPGHSNIGLVYHRIGQILDCQNKNALGCFEKSIEIYKQELPENHPKISAVFHSIGQMYLNNGNLENALENFNKSMSLKNETLPEDHLEIGETLFELGNVSRMRGENENALEYFNKALTIFRAKLIGQHKLIQKCEDLILDYI